jgi:glutaminyl-peptide cyclotransferase
MPRAEPRPDAPAQVPPTRQPQKISAFDQQNAWKMLLRQTDFGPRYPGSEAHIECRDFLVEEMRKHTENVRLQEFTHTWSQTGKPIKMWNVIGEQNWKDAKVRVLLLAHWDTRPSADMEPDPKNARKPIVGANDGASGVAVLLELMRVMKGANPDLGIMYLMTDGEDLGPDLEEMFLGAKKFAKEMPNPRPNYGILLDMVGDKDLRIPMEMNSLRFAPRLMLDFYAFANRIGYGATFPQAQGQMIEDDHIPLNEAGLPTINLIDFTYPYWHTLEDTPDKCSPESLGKVGAVLEAWLKQSPPYRLPAY